LKRLCVLELLDFKSKLIHSFRKHRFSRHHRGSKCSVFEKSAVPAIPQAPKRK